MAWGMKTKSRGAHEFPALHVGQAISGLREQFHHGTRVCGFVRQFRIERRKTKRQDALEVCSAA